ncbi:PhoH family protein [bacterium]|nr:PhoH family protein [candidate division CSSED10-310 bacterium]
MEEEDDKLRIKLQLEPGSHLAAVFGQFDANLRLVERLLNVAVVDRDASYYVVGVRHNAETAARIFKELGILAQQGIQITERDVDQMIRCFEGVTEECMQEVLSDTVLLTSGKKQIVPKSPTQKAYIDAIRAFDLVVGIGPAGTGKTYLAMAMAVSALLARQVSRIVLARPAVEAGESLGFLPGDMYQKVNPYLRPLYDALYDMLSVEKANRLVERGSIEIAPIAYMRGRTLNDSFIILDEAQNTTAEQMKMFLTRLGYNSKAVITGDITQIDLPAHRISGLVQAEDVLNGMKEISFVYFSERDVVRHSLVQRIIRAYERFDERNRPLRVPRGDRPATDQGAAQS